MIFRQPLIDFFKKRNIPQYRAKQLLHAIYREGKNSYDDIKVLPQDLRLELKKHFPIFSFTIAKEIRAISGNTIKTLFKLKNGAEKVAPLLATLGRGSNCLMEGVLMKFKDGRKSVCVSSQVGCGLKCAFCATGQMGFKRNLSAEEIVDQVLYFDQLLKRRGSRVDHVVFMGMGEPMLNYDAVMEAVRIINDPEYLGIAARNITISTSGIIPGIKRLADEKLQVGLAISLHAPNQILREKLMPISKSYKILKLISAIKEYIKQTGRRVSYEYVMLNNVNDSTDLANELAKLLKGQLCHVNLIPYNETYLGFKNAGKARIFKFSEILKTSKIPVTIRVSLGQDISAACGQLSTDTLCSRH